MLVYGIIETQTNECIYVGSTIKPLKERERVHKVNTEKREYLLYEYISDKGWDAFHFEVLEEVDDETLLKDYERYYWGLLSPQYNTYCPLLSEEERVANRKEKDMNYYYSHHEEKKQKNRERYQIKKEERQQYAKEWYANNKEKIKEQNRLRARDYYYANRETIREKERLKYLEKKQS